jgi:peptidylprolyl isomerase
VGAGRDDPPESDGTELYAVIGHAPRQLDRNVALVGRVLQGIELLSSLPRGSGEMGFYVPSEATAGEPRLRCLPEPRVDDLLDCSYPFKPDI